MSTSIVHEHGGDVSLASLNITSHRMSPPSAALFLHLSRIMQDLKPVFNITIIEVTASNSSIHLRTGGLGRPHFASRVTGDLSHIPLYNQQSDQQRLDGIIQGLWREDCS
jgi:hypothetical protein